MKRKRIYIDDIDKDVRRVIGKRLYKKCEEENNFILAERSNGDAEYYFNKEAFDKLLRYMYEHKRSRLYKAWVDNTGCNVRFEIDSWRH